MHPISVVHPCENLIKRVAKDIYERGHVSSALIIFPHRRPASYLNYYLSNLISRPFLGPEIKSFEDWISEVFVSLETQPKTVLSEYDQAWLVYLAAKDVFKDTQGVVSTWEEFFPWALKIVSLFKEFDLELKTPYDISNLPEENIPKGAIKLLERVGELYKRFNEELSRGNFTTEGKRLRFLAENGFPLPDCPIYVVGFYALTNAEDRIFKTLYKEGAYFYWQADVDDLPELYKRWKRQWGVDVKDISHKKNNGPELFFFEAHDLHSELKELKNRLPAKIIESKPDKYAIVLLSSSSLIPLIHHLPQGPVNLTMGYPLKLTGIYIFLESLFSLVLNQDDTRGYRTKDLLDFLKNPYIKGMDLLCGELINFGTPFVTRENILELANNTPDPSYIKELFEYIIGPVERATSPKELSNTLHKIFCFLDIDETFSRFEKEFLKAMLEDVIPVLHDSIFSNVTMNRRGLFKFFENLISSVRIPFEGEPLLGLQVMGPLETRLLSFDEIFFLDINEGVLPDVEEVNPLVPYGIRSILGLPDREREESILRYHFERFLHGAKRANLFWQFKTTGSGGSGFEGKKVKSRYVEKLIWEEEKQQREIMYNMGNKERFKRASINISTDGFVRPDYIKKDEKLKEKIKETLYNISPSLIETYLECPMKFFYSRVLGFRPVNLAEEMDYGELGEAVHLTLKNFIERVANFNFPAHIKKSDLQLKELMEIFEQELTSKDFYKNISPQRKFLLLKGAEYRFFKYIENHPEETEVICVERKFQVNFSLEKDNALNTVLTGIIDRVDKRGDVYVVLDYKTGKVTTLNKNFIEIDVCSPLKEKQFSINVLEDILKYLPDVQLPFYVYLFAKNIKNIPGYKEVNNTSIWERTTAAYVVLRKDGEEKYLIEPNKIEENSLYPDWMRNKFIELIEYLICHIIESPYVYPAILDSACSHCDFWKMCNYAR